MSPQFGTPDLFTGQVVEIPSPSKFARRDDDELIEPIGQWTESARDALVTSLLDGAILDSLSESLRFAVQLRQSNPSDYWRKLSRPKGQDEIDFRDGLLSDLEWIMERGPVFVGCMQHAGANIDSYIDAITQGFAKELKLCEIQSAGGPLFASNATNGTEH